MKGYYIEITNNLLDPKHRKNMGTAVWEFMWCLDKITRIDDDGRGWLLGGKPIKLSEIKMDIGIAENHISNNLTKLKKEGYLEITRTPCGLVIKVMKAQKRFNQKVKSDLTLRSNPAYLKVKSNIRQDKDKTIRQENTSFKTFKTKRPYYKPTGEEMRRTKKDGKWWVIQREGGPWKEFAGEIEDITY